MIIQNLFEADLHTWAFTGLFLLALIILIRKKDAKSIFPVSLTNELKGWAILLIVLSHIGYFLFSNHSFLYPWSIMAGVGVDLFLFLSGFGLVVSAYKKDLGAWEFYKKRLLRLFLPLWIFLIVFLVLDRYVLHVTYPLWQTIKGFLGLYQTADIYRDINSPLWYFTLILFYYLTFPWIFKKEYPAISALLWFLLGYYLTDINWQFFKEVNRLHILHIGAFPLGVMFAGWLYSPPQVLAQVVSGIKKWGKENVPLFLSWVVRIAALAPLVYLICYTALNSGVGGDHWTVLKISLVSVAAVVLTGILKPVRFKLLEWLGIYSYEIYLLHWPILYRYDIVYKYLPAGVATALYLVVFLGLGFLFKLLIDKILLFIND